VTPPGSEHVAILNTQGICTVTQVEELKILIRMLRIWITMILFSTVLGTNVFNICKTSDGNGQTCWHFRNTCRLFAKKRKEIPAASFQIVNVIAVILLLPVYEKVLVPVLRKFTGMANGITPLQRMGISLVFSTLSMVSAALVESHCLQNVRAQGFVDRKVAVPVSIMWQGPQYILIGAGEVFSIGLNEFFYEEAPDAMKSLFVSFSFANDSVGYYLSSLIISLVPVFTASGGSPGWIPHT
jgi:solute carrier family 15 (peptide/histidine transporter), member 3/4